MSKKPKHHSIVSDADAAETLAALQGELTYAERQLTPRGQAESLRRRYLARHVMGLAIAGSIAVRLMLQGLSTPRYVGGALAMWVLFTAVRVLRTHAAIQRGIQQLDEAGEIAADVEEDDSLASAKPPDAAAAERRFHFQAEHLLGTHAAEMVYAEHQLRKAGDYEAVAERLFNRRLTYLILAIPACLILGPTFWSAFLATSVLLGFWQALRTRRALRELIRATA